MNIILQIIVSICLVYGIYMLACAYASKLGETELKRNGCICREDEISIFASPSSLEHCIRAALAESNLTVKKITVNIDAGSPDREKMIYITEAFRKRHSNIRINMM